MKSIYFVVFLLCGIQLCAAQSKQCKTLGQYCQNHNECCSNNCLTYSYKCIKNRFEVNRDAASTNQNLMPELRMRKANSIDELVDRFGGQDNNIMRTQPTATVMERVNASSTPAAQTQEQQTQSPNACYANGRSCMESHQCCSGECSNVTNMCMQRMVPATEASTQAKPPSPMPNVASTPQTCLNIGQKCYNAAINECCPPLRCHGYYHHCVT